MVRYCMGILLNEKHYEISIPPHQDFLFIESQMRFYSINFVCHMFLCVVLYKIGWKVIILSFVLITFDGLYKCIKENIIGRVNWQYTPTLCYCSGYFVTWKYSCEYIDNRLLLRYIVQWQVGPGPPPTGAYCIHST